MHIVEYHFTLVHPWVVFASEPEVTIGTAGSVRVAQG
jgi:hypothetical protein